MERRYSQLNQSRAPGARGYSKTINQAERQARAAAVNHQPSRASGARGYSNHQQIDINIRGGWVANQLVTASHRHTHPSDGSALGRQAVQLYHPDRLVTSKRLRTASLAFVLMCILLVSPSVPRAGRLTETSYPNGRAT